MILKYILRRLAYVIPIMMGVTLFIFILFNVAAGDPTPVLLGKYATAQQMEELRHELGLDKPLFYQYLDLLKSIFSFDLGRSWKSKQLIINMLIQGIKNSLTITVPVFCISGAIAIAVSLFLTTLRNKIYDRLVVISCVILMSISILAYILFGQWFLAFKLGLFEICGYEAGFPYFIPYVILPVIIGVILGLGHDIRYYRSIIMDEASQDYVRTAKAKGLPTNTILFKHILRNAMIPIVGNALAQLPSLVIGSIVVENFFSIPGFGNIILQAIYNSDLPVIKAATILIALSCIFFNILSDVVCVILDPRVRFSK